MRGTDEISEYIKRCVEIINGTTVEALQYLGEECVNRIRDRIPENSWHDRTGNLRSSIGYAIVYNGKLISTWGFDSSFLVPSHSQKVEFTTKSGKKVSFMAKVNAGGEGPEEGKRFLNEIIATEITSDSDYALIVLAGMNYAEILEKEYGKDVLSGTELWAREEWQKRLQDIDRKIQTRINLINN